MKDLKSNPKALSLLKRRTLIDALVLELVFNPKIRDISYKVTSSEIVFIVNSVEHRFRMNTPVSLIRKYFLNMVLHSDLFTQIDKSFTKTNDGYGQSFLFN